MTLIWFDVSPYGSPAEALAAVRPFGVELMSPYPDAAQFYWSEDANGVLVDAGIHRLYDDGRIRLRPFSYLPTRLLTIFISSAEHAFKHKPKSSDGWTRVRTSKKHPEPHWYSSVVMRADGTSIAELVRAARSTAPSRTQVQRLTVASVEAAVDGNPTWDHFSA